jgi:DNA-binding MarR family transcriptional regulator
MPLTAVDEVRHFNRTVTERLGALGDNFLGLHRPLGESRILWEIGHHGCEVRLLRARLGLDSGYTSRMLRSLETAALIKLAPSTTDRRIRVARLTAAGRRALAALDKRADEHARSLLAPLTSQQQERLVVSMRDVARLLTAAGVEIASVDPEHPHARYCLAEYVSELNRRADRAFDPTVGATALPHEVRPPAGEFFVAYLHGEPVGCGAVKHHPGGACSSTWRLPRSTAARASPTSRRAPPSPRRSASTGQQVGSRWNRSTTSRSRTTGSRRSFARPHGGSRAPCAPRSRPRPPPRRPA